MGCDIHFYVERRAAGGGWQSADTWAEEYGRTDVPYGSAFYYGRNYGLFAILAGVRDRHGVTPVAPPRGVPNDASPEYRGIAENDDGHSHSWLTLAEILAFDWTQTVEYSGVVDPVEWARARDNKGRGPDSYSVSVGGGNVTHHSAAMFEAAWQALRAERDYPTTHNASAHLTTYAADNPDLKRFCQLVGGGSPYTEIQWTVPYHRAAGSEFWGETIPRMLALGAPEDVRCCFFFDS